MSVENIENIKKLYEAVRKIAYDVHVYLSNGYLEKVYENCLKHRLEKAGFDVETQVNLKVHDEDGFEIGDYFADMVVNKCLIVELKAAKAITSEHLSQTMNYLKVTGYPLGMVINFGSYKFETRKVYPPVEFIHGERVDHVEGACEASPCSTWTKTPDDVIHGERVDHVDSDTPCEASPCSTCSTWTKKPGNFIHGERVDHVDSDTPCEASPCSPCSTWTKKPGNFIHGERVEHVDSDTSCEASPCSPCSPWTKAPGDVIHGERVDHVEEKCEASPCSPWTKTPGNAIHGERVDHVEEKCEASPCSI